MSITLPLGSTANSLVQYNLSDFTTVFSAIKNGFPTDPNQINTVVLAALRILSETIVAAATILGFSAIQMTEVSELTAIFPTILAPALSAIIVFHDLYVGSATITSSLTPVAAPALTLTANKGLMRANSPTNFNTRMPSPKEIRFDSGKTLHQVVQEGSSSFATELTSRMWAMKWILVKTHSYWAPAVAKRFYNVSLPTTP